MRYSKQTRLVDFDESTRTEKTKSRAPPIKRQGRHRGKIWHKAIKDDEEYGVCNFDGTVLLVRFVDGRIHAHGVEAVCKWCGSILVICDDKVFCGGECGRYQGEFSKDLNSYLRWEGVKSYTLRKVVAEIEKLELEPRDLEPMAYAPNWSVLEEYEEELQHDE